MNIHTLAIVGSRNFSDYEKLCEVMVQFFLDSRDGYGLKEIISGGAKGSDCLGAKWAREHGVRLTEFLPDWDKFGRAAGTIRNEEIVKTSDAVLAFWSGDAKTSPGTASTLSIAKRLKKPTIVVYF